MTAHETIFDAINGVHRDPYLSLSAANAVIEALDAAGYTITPGPTRCVPRQNGKISYVCSTCHAHWDHHDNRELCCPAYTSGDGSVVFSTTHHYSGELPPGTTKRNVIGEGSHAQRGRH